ncbi:hypothetical protein BACCOP_01458 [Phocaeicola coprocola DSM 17136]|uniref:NVEALA protein n=1 Tax=Phocaeicola coprocola DSM 17136 TaxID=470145 RepID=B3JHU6_9BACT|nr:NVEALA domain-containing protein [Phocaeicola coprocola]EDV01515.1 hypothetical protein BACCOP_01458 [Phocaeicola coprocola DSM 17136]
MNKKILKVVFASAFALVAGYSVYASQQEVEMSDLAMANVEALAGGESGTVKCCPDPGDECKLSSGDILEGQDEC